jgi:hypothetical protein
MAAFGDVGEFTPTSVYALSSYFFLVSGLLGVFSVIRLLVAKEFTRVLFIVAALTLAQLLRFVWLFLCDARTEDTCRLIVFDYDAVDFNIIVVDNVIVFVQFTALSLWLVLWSQMLSVIGFERPSFHRMWILFNSLVWVATIVLLLLHRLTALPIQVGIYMSMMATLCLAAGFFSSCVSDPGVPAARTVRMISFVCAVLFAIRTAMLFLPLQDIDTPWTMFFLLGRVMPELIPNTLLMMALLRRRKKFSAAKKHLARSSNVGTRGLKRMLVSVSCTEMMIDKHGFLLPSLFHNKSTFVVLRTLIPRVKADKHAQPTGSGPSGIDTVKGLFARPPSFHHAAAEANHRPMSVSSRRPVSVTSRRPMSVTSRNEVGPSLPGRAAPPGGTGGGGLVAVRSMAEGLMQKSLQVSGNMTQGSPYQWVWEEVGKTENLVEKNPSFSIMFLVDVLSPQQRLRFEVYNVQSKNVDSFDPALHCLVGTVELSVSELSDQKWELTRDIDVSLPEKSVVVPGTMTVQAHSHYNPKRIGGTTTKTLHQPPRACVPLSARSQPHLHPVDDLDIFPCDMPLVMGLERSEAAYTFKTSKHKNLNVVEELTESPYSIAVPYLYLQMRNEELLKEVQTAVGKVRIHLFWRRRGGGGVARLKLTPF